MPANIQVGAANVAFNATDASYQRVAQRWLATQGQVISHTRTTTEAAFRQATAANYLKNNIDRVTTSLKSSLIATAGYALGVNAARAALFGTVRAFGEFEQGLIGVAKTAGLTREEMASLEYEFDRLLTRESTLGGALPVAAENLLEIAQVAGQMRIQGVRDITKFTETISLLELTTTLAGEEAANAMGLILSNTAATVNEVEQLGSVLTALGNEFRGGEQGIVSQATEIARQTAEFRLAAEDILAFSAVYAQAGSRSEQTGTVFQRSLRALVEAAGEAASGLPHRLQAIADAAEVSIDHLFDTIRRRDWTSALRIFAQALSNLESLGTDTQATDSSLLTYIFGGQQPPVRIAGTLGVLTEQINELDRAFRIARQEFDDPHALIEEASRAAEGSLKRLQVVQSELADQARTVGGLLLDIGIPIAEQFRIIEVAIAGAAVAFATGFARRKFEAARERSRLLTEEAYENQRHAVAGLTGRQRELTAAQQKAATASALHTKAVQRLTAAQRDLDKAQRRYVGVPVRAGFFNQASPEAQRFARQSAANIAQREAALAAAQASQVQSNRIIATTTERVAKAREEVRNATTHLAQANHALALRTSFAARATNFLRRSLAFIGGPLGLVFTALTLGATAWAVWGNRVDEQRERLRRTEEAVDRIRQAISKLRRDREGLSSLGELEHQIREEELQPLLDQLEEQQTRRSQFILDLQKVTQPRRGGILGVPAEQITRSVRESSGLAELDRAIAETVTQIQTLEEELAKLRDEAEASQEIERTATRFKLVSDNIEDATRQVRDFQRTLDDALNAQHRTLAAGDLPLNFSAADVAGERAITAVRLKITQELLKYERELADALDDQLRLETLLAAQQAQFDSVEGSSEAAVEILKAIEATRERIRLNDELIDRLNERDQAAQRITGREAEIRQQAIDAAKQSQLEQLRVIDGLETWISTLSNVEDAFVNLARTGKLNFSDLVDSIIADLARMLVRANITANLAGVLQQVFPFLFGNTGNAGASPSTVTTNPFLYPYGGNFHGGGVVQGRGRESLALLERGEEVLTRGDPRHRYNIGGYSRADLQAWVSGLPKFHGGGVFGGDSGARSGRGGFTIELVNNSQRQLEAVPGDNRIEGQRFIEQVILRDVGRNGDITRNLAVAVAGNNSRR